MDRLHWASRRVETLQGLHGRLGRAPLRAIRAEDGTLKFAWPFEPGGAIETVLIPSGRGRSTVCVSTQRGCRRGCLFCATGRDSRAQNLTPDEVELQVARAVVAADAFGLPVPRNLVFMGMGEPLDNFRAVQTALERLVDPRGWAFAPRHVTVSTVGPSVRAIERTAAWPGRLAWSLHSAIDRVRQRLVPTARHPVRELAEAFGRVVRHRNQPLFVELTLLEGENDDLFHADAALALFADFPREVRFNLLPVNPTGAEFRPPAPERVERFQARLMAGGRRALIRRARGRDRDAACGQLGSLRTLPGWPGS